MPGVGKGLGPMFHSSSVLNHFKIATSDQIKTLFGSHIIGLWPLADTSGSVAVDVSGNGYNAAYVGSPSYSQEGLDGTKAIGFTNGKLNIYSAGLISKFNPDEGFCSFWVKTAIGVWDNASDKRVMYFTSDKGANRIMFNIGNTGYITAFHIAGSTNRYAQSYSPHEERWYHVGFRWSKAAGALTTFINGVETVKYAVVLGTWSGSLLSDGAELFSLGIAYKAQYALLLDYAPTNADIQTMIEPAGTICFAGDSRSANYYWNFAASGIGLNKRADFGADKYAVRVEAVANSTVAVMAARATATNAMRIANKKSIMVVWIGVNDAVAPRTAQQIYDDTKAYCIAARAAGWNKIILCSEIDSQNVDRPTWHGTIWPELNALIYADHSFADALADLGAIPQLQDSTNTTYFDALKLHPTVLGYSYVRNCVAAAIASIA